MVSQIMQFLRPGSNRKNVALLGRFLILLLLIVVLFSVFFHVLMRWEGREFSWWTGVYWTLTVMSTLGFGDITFGSDLGRFFSIVVLLTGMVFLLMLMPFTFIEFFYSPWMRLQQERRAPRQVPKEMQGHVVLISDDPVAMGLIGKLKQYGYPYVLVEEDLQKALVLHDKGIDVVVADLKDEESYQALGLERAAMLALTGTDVENTNVTFSARNFSENLTIVATANSQDSLGVLKLAGANHVVRLGDLLGASLGRRTIGGDAQAHLIGELGEIKIAEAMVIDTPLVGKKLKETKLRESTGVTAIGLWERGKFRLPMPEDVIEPSTVLVLAGTQEEINRYNELLCIYRRSHGQVVIVGAGRVGRATGHTLADLGIEYRIIDPDPKRILNRENYILGSAADPDILEEAGIHDAPAVIITPREDDLNIYLTIYLRKLRPDIQIIARATQESNINRLHRAGADFVMSYASIGANIFFNLLRKGNILMVAEGLNVIRIPVPDGLIGKSLMESQIREKSGCSVIAIRKNEETIRNPSPTHEFSKGEDLVLIGTVEAEETFFEEFN